MKGTYKHLSLINDERFRRIKKIFVENRFFGRSDVIFGTNDGIVYGFGDNIFAILGMRKEIKISVPKVIEELRNTDIRKVRFGDRFMVVLTESHEVYTGGYCAYGRCGNGINSDTYCKPKKVLIDGQTIIDIDCSLAQTLILTDKQQVYSFGFCFETRGAVLTPKLITDLGFTQIKSIACGGRHSIVLTLTGKVYSWGSNQSGQLGLSHNNDEGNLKLIEMPNSVSVKHISAGFDFSLLLTNDGNIYSFG